VPELNYFGTAARQGWESKCVAPTFLTSALDVDVSHPWLGGPQRRSGPCGLDESLFPLPGMEPQFLHHPGCNTVTILTELSQLPVEKINLNENETEEMRGSEERIRMGDTDRFCNPQHTMSSGTVRREHMQQGELHRSVIYIVFYSFL
jgi:hypothetical protein